MEKQLAKDYNNHEDFSVKYRIVLTNSDMVTAFVFALRASKITQP